MQESDRKRSTGIGRWIEAKSMASRSHRGGIRYARGTQG